MPEGWGPGAVNWMDILERVYGEHHALRVHLEAIEAAAEADDDEALGAALQAARLALTEGLDTHILSEESELFGAITKSFGEEMVVPFREEHAEIRALRDEVISAAGRGAAAHTAALVLCELILDHQRREDLLLFPSAREATRT
jgi:hypothetical protein